MCTLLKEKSVLSALDEELKAQGFAGSTDVAKLVFLSAYTRHFADPVAMVLKGPTSSGKSFALDAGLQFIPPSAFKKVSALTPKSLAYMGDELKHKYLIVREAAGLSRGVGQVLLRQLITDHRIDYATVKLGEGGSHQWHPVVAAGPTGVLMTTTDQGLHPEDESRMLSYPVRSSVEKIRAALLGQTKKPAKLDDKPWFDLDKYVASNPHNVVIPYVRALAAKVPPSLDRVQRDFPKVLNLIRAHALMHPRFRKRTREGIVATEADYLAVRGLIEEPLSRSVSDAIPETLKQLIEAVRANKDGASQSDLASQLGRNQSVVSRTLKLGIAQGYLVDKNPGKGKTAVLMIGDRQLPNGKFLPERKELFKATRRAA
jgi:hypothetical protein